MSLDKSDADAKARPCARCRMWLRALDLAASIAAHKPLAVPYRIAKRPLGIEQRCRPHSASVHTRPRRKAAGSLCSRLLSIAVLRLASPSLPGFRLPMRDMVDAQS